MYFSKRFLFALSLLAVATLFSDCDPNDETSPYVTVLLRLTHKSGTQALEFNQKKYSNSLGQSYSVTKLNYFISNIKMRNKVTGDFYFEVNSYHLVKASLKPDNSEIILLNVPKRKFSELEFSIGVDNSVNHSTDHVGDLDPGNGMAWDWTTGYKFMELEGDFTTSTNSGAYVFHVGEDPNYKTLTFDFKAMTGSDYDLVKAGQILVDVDINAAFTAPNPVDFNTFFKAESISAGSSKIAANCANGMFKLTGAQ